MPNNTLLLSTSFFFFFFQAEDGIRDDLVTGVQTCAFRSVFITGVAGMTQLNGKFFSVLAASGGTITLGDLNGNNINSTAYGVWTSGGTTARVYTLPTPYNTVDLPTLKYAQSVQNLILCNPNYAPYVLTYISATNWTLNPITFGSTILAPTGVAVTTTQSNTGVFSYAYVVTAVDANGQESGPSAIVTLNGFGAAGGKTNSITWNTVPGAIFYNIYSTGVGEKNQQAPSGAAFGFIGFCTGVAFNDIGLNSPIAPDFQVTPPIPQNPFQGAGVDHVNVTASGAPYTSVPGVTFAAAPSGGATATGLAVLQLATESVVIGEAAAVGKAISFPRGVV